MPRANPDDTDRLMRSIAALSAAPADITRHGRRLRREGGGTLAAVLSEIDETVLPRRLVFERTNAAKLAMVVAERRLISVLEVPPDLADRQSGILGRALEESDAPEISALLGRFCRAADDVFVISHLLDERAGAGFSGIPCRMLQAPQPSSEWPNLPVAITRALTSSKACAQALVLLDKTLKPTQFGPSELCNALCAVLNARRRHHGAGNHAALWRSSPNPDHATLIVHLDGMDVAAVLPTAEAENCFKIWSRLIRPVP